MFDTHCHLNIDPLYKKHLDVIKSARENGVKQFLIPGNNLNSSRKSIEISSDFEGVYSAIGIHPTENLEKVNVEKVFSVFEDLIEENEKIVAVGECGLDYFRYKSPTRIQRKVLKKHINFASKHALTLILHNRMATEDLICDLRKNYSPSHGGRVVFHCCPPEDILLNYAVENSIYIGICGDVTYDYVKQDFIKKVPVELLVLETDSPFLTPAPARSKVKFPNTPSNLRYISEKVAELKGISVDEVNKVTTKNAIMLFAIN
jgi:TatD DNase family protein